ncbi:MAG: transglycosylase domain-containing protein [Bacilli bacterium]|nr:transglycosylase domain-containing protein [Bacilli bacterium]
MKKTTNEKKNIKRLTKIILFMILFLIMFTLSFFTYVYYTAPEFDSNLLYKKESSNIYDSKGDLITTIGSEKRHIVSYEELPQVLIDSIIATEDSRFFMHNGLDIPRFMKASVSYVAGNNIGGASTLTMQISKNTYTSFDADGFTGIVRKFTDIYMSIFKIEKDYNKKEIIEFYVNAPYLGGGTYGVQMASEVYFGKDVSDLNLVEAAMIAGMFQAPGEYDPYVNPEKTNVRKNEVIDLMLRHGYITENIAHNAKLTDIKNYLVDRNYDVNIYQGFIDTVVQEVIDRTGNNPYEVSMDIYSTMVKSKQDVINNFYNTHKFKDNKVQVGIGIIDNDTGAIIAVGAGRNKNSEMSLNYATQISRHPGSTAKPLFDYGPGIEYKNWSTYTPFYDKPVSYTNGGTMRNVDNKYQGFLTLEQCLVRSRNTCALQAFQSLSNSKINKFVTSLGITPEYLGNNYFINEAHSIGGFTGVSPVELAAAYAAFGNGGFYTEPHSITKIVYKDGKNENVEEFNFNKKRAMKETTAYMISYMLKKATNSGVKVSGTDIATKTGTSSYDSNRLKSLGLSTNVIQDAWTVTFSPDYSVAIWYGYDELTKKTYNTSSHAWSERTKIQKKIVNNIMEKNSRFDRPSGIVTSKVVVGSNPPKLPNSTTPSSKIQTHLFIKGTQPTRVSSDYYYPEPITEEIITEEIPINILP